MKRFLLLLSLLPLTTSCSTMWSSDPSAGAPQDETAAAPEEPTAPEEAAAEKAPAPASRVTKAISESGTSTVEVLWQVPGEAVEKYHLYYGLEADELTNHIEVSVAELQKVDDPKHGPVYRYELKDIPAQRSIFLSLRAENKYGMSDASPATRVSPGQKTVTP